jgi:sulfur carrier protein ThiS
MENPKEVGMVVKLILRNQEFEVRPGMTVAHALEKINVKPETVLATRGGELITEDEILNEGDVIKLVAVISGGRQ